MGRGALPGPWPGPPAAAGQPFTDDRDRQCHPQQCGRKLPQWAESDHTAQLAPSGGGGEPTQAQKTTAGAKTPTGDGNSLSLVGVVSFGLVNPFGDEVGGGEFFLT